MYALITLFLKDFKNVIIAFLLIVIFVLLLNLFSKNGEINNLKEDIAKLTNEKVELSLSIDKQNLAIKQLNEEQKIREQNFNKKYQELKENQKPTIRYIEKQNNYISPADKTELEATKEVLRDFVKNRDSK